MALLRSVLHALWMFVTVVPGRSSCCWWLDLDARHTAATGWRRAWLSWAVGSARVRCWASGLRVSGMENLPADKLAGAILLVKHQSTLETFLMPTLMPHPPASCSKELLYVPFFGWAHGPARHDPHRPQPARPGLQQGGEQGRAARAGHLDHHVPRGGTRIPRGQKGTYKSGGTRLACETGVPAIPIAVTSAKVWPRKALHQAPRHGRRVPSACRRHAGRKPDELMRESRPGSRPRCTASIPRRTAMPMPPVAWPAGSATVEGRVEGAALRPSSLPCRPSPHEEPRTAES